MADAARREARGPEAVRNPGQGKQIKGIKKSVESIDGKTTYNHKRSMAEIVVSVKFYT